MDRVEKLNEILFISFLASTPTIIAGLIVYFFGNHPDFLAYSLMIGLFVLLFCFFYDFGRRK